MTSTNMDKNQLKFFTKILEINILMVLEYCRFSTYLDGPPL